MKQAYFLDPDHNACTSKTPVVHCCRCYKALNVKTAIRVSFTDAEGWYVKQDACGSELIGPDCWKTISEEK